MCVMPIMGWIYFPMIENYTIGSMAKLLRDLEEPPKSSSCQLFVGLGPLSAKFLGHWNDLF